MPKPDHVRCETCVFWQPTRTPTMGVCARHPPIHLRAGDPSVSDYPPACAIQWCGEWSNTWPGPRHVITTREDLSPEDIAAMRARFEARYTGPGVPVVEEA